MSFFGKLWGSGKKGGGGGPRQPRGKPSPSPSPPAPPGGPAPEQEEEEQAASPGLFAGLSLKTPEKGGDDAGGERPDGMFSGLSVKTRTPEPLAVDGNEGNDDNDDDDDDDDDMQQQHSSFSFIGGGDDDDDDDDDGEEEQEQEGDNGNGDDEPATPRKDAHSVPPQQQEQQPDDDGDNDDDGGADGDTEASPFGFLLGDAAGEDEAVTLEEKPLDFTAMGMQVRSPEQQQQQQQQEQGKGIEGLLDRLSHALTAYWENIARVHAQQNAVRSREASGQARLATVEARLSATEAEQAAAIDAEEYDKADKLNDEMERLKREMASLQSRMGQTDEDMARLTEQKEAESSRLAAEVDRTVAALEVMRQEQRDAMDALVEEETKRLNTREDRLHADMDRIERALAHLAGDLSFVSEEEAGIEDDIKKQTADVQSEREALLAHKADVDAEIEDLQRRLKAKTEERAGLVAQLEVVDSKIAETRTAFQRSLSVLKQKKERILGEQADTQSQQRQLEEEKTALHEQMNALDVRKRDFADTLARIARERARAEALVKRLESDRERFRAWDAVEAGTQRELRELSEAAAAADGDIERLSQEQAELELELTEEEKNIMTVDASLPGLEAKKKLAVKSRNFKQAGAVSKEIKELTAAREAAQAKIADLQGKISACHDRMDEVVAARNTKRDALQKAQSENDVARARALLEKQYYLERLAAHDDVLAAEARALAQQIDYCKAGLTDLRKKNDWDDDFPFVEGPRTPVDDGDEGGGGGDGDGGGGEEEREAPDAADGDDDGDDGDDGADKEEEDEKKEENAEEEEELQEEDEKEKEEDEEEEENEDGGDGLDESERLREELREVEAAIEAAVEAEDFDEADRLESRAEAIRSRIPQL